MSSNSMTTGLGKADFAQFLFDRELISQEQADLMRERSESGRVPIGQLFIQKKLCTVRQVMDLVALQAECPTVRFGELALRCKFVTTLQLEEVLSFQKNHRSHQIEVARYERILSKEDLIEQVICYVRFMELQSLEIDVEVSRSFAQVG